MSPGNSVCQSSKQQYYWNLNNICIFTKTGSKFPLSSWLCLFSGRKCLLQSRHGWCKQETFVKPFIIFYMKRLRDLKMSGVKLRWNIQQLKENVWFILFKTPMFYSSANNRKQPGKGQKGNCGNRKYCACWFKLLWFWNQGGKQTRTPMLPDIEICIQEISKVVDKSTF